MPPRRRHPDHPLEAPDPRRRAVIQIRPWNDVPATLAIEPSLIIAFEGFSIHVAGELVATLDDTAPTAPDGSVLPHPTED